jgi:hypothetical protein
MTGNTDINLLVTDTLKENGPHNRPQDLLTVFLCIQIAIDKMQLVFEAYACPYHNPTATMGHSVHQQTALPHDTIQMVCGLGGRLDILPNSPKQH